MTDIALDKRAKFAAQLRNAANEMRAEDHNGWPVLCDIVADYLDASPSQVAPANPAQVTDAKAIVDASLPPHEQAMLGHDAITVLTDAIAAAIGAGGQAVADLTYGQKLIAEAIEHHFGERAEDYDEDSDDTTNRDVWEAFDALSQPHPADERVMEALRRMLSLFDDQGNLIADFAQMQGAIGNAYQALSVKEGR